MSNELQRAKKIVSQLDELASISEDVHAITRTFGTKAFIKGRDKVLRWMEEAGLQTRIDNIGNVRGVLASANSYAKTWVIGSHIDTVINAGKFDGPLGVLMGLDLLRNAIQSEKQFPFHIELIAFCDEEGVRFHTTYLGSKVVAGTFDTTILTIKDESGTALADVIHKMNGEVGKLPADAIPKDNWLGYFEIHIEQGPVLYEKNIPVAVVTAIAAQMRVEIIFKGMAGHAGTVPMDMRNDALACAAECILELEKMALANKQDIVATVGKLHIVNAASNVIPGEVICSLDLRSANEKALSFIYQAIWDTCKQTGSRRGVTIEWKPVQQSKPVVCDRAINTLLSQSIREAGYEIIELVSGAGHDAVAISAVSPVAMLFVRCFKGISHNPLENVELKDIAAAIKVSDNFIQQILYGSTDPV